MHTWRTHKTVVLGILVAVISLGAAATTRAQTVYSTFFNDSGYYWERGSYDRGVNWFGWDLLPHYDGCVDQSNIFFTGPLSVASDKPHSLWMAAKDTNGFIVLNAYDGGSHSWGTWCPFFFQGDLAPGGTWINARYYTWIDGSTPVLSSWGPGRFDMWLVARRDDGALTLLHGWTGDTPFFIFTWEALGTGLFSGNPAVVSWAPGRVDIFIRAADHGLVHKWYDHGWSRGWEDTGAYVTSNPTVTSSGPGQLDLFVAGGDQALWQRTFANGNWTNWFSRGGILQPGTSPSAAARGPGMVDVLLYGTDGIPRQFSITNNVLTDVRVVTDSWAFQGSAIYWVP